MKVLDQLEEQINRGFFLSFVNKIVVDEKKIFTIINELRSLVSEHFSRDAAPVPMEPKDTATKQPDSPAPAPSAEAENEPQDDAAARDVLDRAREQAEILCRDADKYADGLLSQLEERLTGALDSVRQGRRVIKNRENKPGGETHGSAEI